ncbi:MAG: hypothetical protein WC047_00225 [Kiritimatiellales bacterium]
MTNLEKMAQTAGVTYMNPGTNSIDVLGEDAFDKLAKVVTSKGKGYHGYRTGCFDDNAREYWWVLNLGNHPNPAMAELVSNNMD